RVLFPLRRGFTSFSNHSSSRMVETSLEAVACAEPRCLLALSRQCPHRVDLASWTRLPKQNPACRFPAPGSPNDIHEELRVRPLDAKCARRVAQTTSTYPGAPSSTDVVDLGVPGHASTDAGFHGGSSSAFLHTCAGQSTGRSHATSP